MGAYHQKPAANPPGGNHGYKDVKIRRDREPHSIYGGAFGEAWEHVKANPVETLLLSFIFLLFNGGGSGGCNMPGGGGGGGSRGGGTESWEQTSQFGGDIGGMVGDIVGTISGLEMALIGGIIFFAVAVMVVMLVIGTLVRGGVNIYWLRLIRGQSATIGHTFAASRFFFGLLVASFVSGVLILLGAVFLIVPGIILALGFWFITQICVDKNLGFLEALGASWELTDGHKLDLFVFSILCFLLNLAGLLACCVGMIVSNAVVMGATAIVYDRLAEPGNAYLDDGEAPSHGFDADVGGQVW